MANTEGHWYYLGKDGKEYFELHDAQRYGKGAVGKRWHSPIKKFEAIPYEELHDAVPAEEPKTQANGSTMKPEAEVETDMVDVPEGIMEFDNLNVQQLKEVLRRKGIISKGNPSRETLLEKLKNL